MSFVPLVLNLLLATLLITALAVGVRLERRLKDLRKSHQSFALAVQELNSASARAQAGLTQLRITAQESGDVLSSRIVQARALADQLDQSMAAALELAKAPLTLPVQPSVLSSKPRVRLAHDARTGQPLGANPVIANRADPHRGRNAKALDDDLFDEPAKPFGGRQ
jgi:hypothetical protein